MTKTRKKVFLLFVGGILLFVALSSVGMTHIYQSERFGLSAYLIRTPLGFCVYYPMEGITSTECRPTLGEGEKVILPLHGSMGATIVVQVQDKEYYAGALRKAP